MTETNDEIMENNLDLILKVAPYMQEVLGKESVFALANKENYIYIVQGEKLKLPVKVGDPIKPGSIADNCLQAGSKISRRIPASVLGIPYIGMGIPVTDNNGRIIGVIATGSPIEIQEKVSGMAINLNSFLDGLSTTSSSLMSASEQLAATAQELADNTSGIDKDVKDMDSVIALIKEVSDQTHLLGLNAAIEAARAGDQGRGFNVVAGEIRKLAARTNSSVKDIGDKLKHIQETVMDFTTQIHEISAVSEEQAASTEEISANLEKIKTMAEELAKMADEMLNK